MRITARPAATIARLGLTRTFQHESFFRGLPVRDNVLVGATTIAHGAERNRAADGPSTYSACAPFRPSWPATYHMATSAY